MPDKETIQQISGFGELGEGENVPILEPEFGITIEYTESDDGYKYVSAINLPRPIKLGGYETLDLFKFLTEALCRRFDNGGCEEIFNPFTETWRKSRSCGDCGSTVAKKK